MVEHTQENNRLDFGLGHSIEMTFPNPEQAELRGEIYQSLLVPQVGEYHNEGKFLESHFRLIQKAIKAVQAGEFHEAVSEWIRPALVAAASQTEQNYDGTGKRGVGDPTGISR